jgi:hypothetical protein
LSVDGFSFDLSAAEWRRGATDEKALAKALAVRLEQALPSKAIVERHRSFFSKETPVRRIMVNFDDEQFQLTHDKREGIRTAKAKMGRGIVLKTVPLEFAQWLAELSAALETYAQQHEETREALQRFLFS